MSADTTPGKTPFSLTEENIRTIDDKIKNDPSLLANIIREAQRGDELAIEYLIRSQFSAFGAEEIEKTSDGRVTAKSGVLVTMTYNEDGMPNKMDTIVNVENNQSR